MMWQFTIGEVQATAIQVLPLLVTLGVQEHYELLRSWANTPLQNNVAGVRRLWGVTNNVHPLFIFVSPFNNSLDFCKHVIKFCHPC